MPQERRSERPRKPCLTKGLLVAILLCIPLGLGAQTLQPPRYRFDIPSQPLSSALRLFAQQGRQEILFTPSLVAGRESPGVSGSLPPLQALETLLEDTGLTFSITPAGAILLHGAPTAPAGSTAPQAMRQGAGWSRFGFSSHVRHTHQQVQSPRPSGEQRA